MDTIEVNGQIYQRINNYLGQDVLIMVVRPLDLETGTNARPEKISGWVRFKTRDLKGAAKQDYYRKA